VTTGKVSGVSVPARAAVHALVQAATRVSRVESGWTAGSIARLSNVQRLTRRQPVEHGGPRTAAVRAAVDTGGTGGVDQPRGDGIHQQNPGECLGRPFGTVGAPVGSAMSIGFQVAPASALRARLAKVRDAYRIDGLSGFDSHCLDATRTAGYGRPCARRIRLLKTPKLVPA